MLIYPNIVNMLGEMTIDVNAMCLDRTQTYILMIEQRMVGRSPRRVVNTATYPGSFQYRLVQTATCMVLNPSIARCNVPRIYDWGTKTVYFQPQTGKANDEKAYVGYVYFGTNNVPDMLKPTDVCFSPSNTGPDAIGYRKHIRLVQEPHTLPGTFHGHLRIDKFHFRSCLCPGILGTSPIPT